MTDQSAPEQGSISPELLRGMADAAGVTLTAEQIAILRSQTEQHFALLGHLNAIADSSTEPAGELRLDCWTTSGSE